MYFNENDSFAADWLTNLFPGATVDRRSIVDVKETDLAGFERCHFFGGIGGWQYALTLAGWPSGWPVWSGSCPCQPFSDAGERKAEEDERHLWPELLRLIAECRPPTIFGEQVASSLGREWLAGVRADLEAVGYEVGAADLCAASVGAPHRRQRLYWVAHSSRARIRDCGRGSNAETSGITEVDPEERQRIRTDVGNGCSNGAEIVANAKGSRWRMVGAKNERTTDREIDTLANTDTGCVEGLGNTTGERLQEQRSEYRPSGERCSGLIGFAVQTGVPEWNGPTVAVECSDGYRRVSAQPEAFPLAHGVSRRSGKLRGAGNAIVPQLAAVFIRSVMEVLASE